MNRRWAALFVMCFFGLLCTGFSLGQAKDAPAYLNPDLPVEQRVNDLVGRMTLEEKASQMINRSAAISRLNVPAYDWWSEALHGVAVNGVATVYPEPIGLAASFDAPLIREMATQISTEARAKHNIALRSGASRWFQGLTFWSPNVNIVRDPRWGRGQETYGEDPFLTGKMGTQFVLGMQGDDPKYLKVVATPKHYAVHSGPEPLRHGFDAKVSRHDMVDTYLPAFRETVTAGKAGSVMCVYNRINGVPGCASPLLLTDILRTSWRLNGYVVSDCDAVTDIRTGHHFVETLAQTAAVSVKAGMDLECKISFSEDAQRAEVGKYVDAVNQGLISEADLDNSLRRTFRARFLLGMFDPPERVKYAQTPDSVIDAPEHRQTALKAARESMVLLKNDGTLPLPASTKRIAVVGPFAEHLRVLLGNYNGTPSHAVTALEGIRKQFSNAEVTYDPGTNTKVLRYAEPFPVSVLTTPDGQPGLRMEVFADETFSGTPLSTSVVTKIDLDESSKATSSGIRYSGWLTPKESGTYQVGIYSTRSRVLIDGKVVVEDVTPHFPSTNMKPIQLEKGRKYSIAVEVLPFFAVVAKPFWFLEIPDPVGKAVASAKQADVVVAVVGMSSEMEGEEGATVDLPGFKGGDRTTLDLPTDEEELLKAVKATGKPLVVVLMNGSAFSVNWVDKNANAILEAWYSGEEGGTAIAETLAGVSNPAGRLPVTFYKGIEQLPDFTDYSMQNRTYRYFRGEPLYRFGYGLSYSKFEYSGLKLSATQLKAGEDLTVTADVKNVSKRDGDEVVQVYLTFPTVPGAPLRALRAFQRVHLKGGEVQRVSFTLGPEDLHMVNEKGDRVVAAGNYRLSLGGGQPDTSGVVAAGLTIRGEKKLPD